MTARELAAHHLRQAELHVSTLNVVRRRGGTIPSLDRLMRFHAKAAALVISMAGPNPLRHEAKGMLLIMEGRGW